VPHPTNSAPELPTLAAFETLVRWRRDVRRFTPQPISPHDLSTLLNIANLAPSVGNSQPWRVVQIESPERRATVRANFEAANAKAACDYDQARRAEYENLKLAGFDHAPVHLCIFCDPNPAEGHGLGRQTQPETLDYSCVGLINILWLSARTLGIGMGWVSILDHSEMNTLLDVPPTWRFVGYLLLGYPEEEHEDPELVRHGWQARVGLTSRHLIR
jgi:5,6-dimethylbenzimidazole synthase